MAEHLVIKWGTLKGWSVESDKCRDALRRYHDDPVSWSVMSQRDTPKQVDALCDLIDAVEGEIIADWTGEKLSKDDAKKYLLEYRR